jgi:hypothetical protein
MFPSWVLWTDLHEGDGNSRNVWEGKLSKGDVGQIIYRTPLYETSRLV